MNPREASLRGGSSRDLSNNTLHQEVRLKQLGLRFAFIGLAAGLLLLAAQPSFATVSGELLTGGTGTLTWSDTSLQFIPNDHGFSAEVAAGTNLTFAGCASSTLGVAGCLSQGEGIDVNDGNPITSSGPITDFLTFAGNSSLIYSLSGYDAGSSDLSCATLTVGQSCSVFAGSPIVLTRENGNKTDLELGVFGTVVDGVGPSANWTGAFTATVSGKTPGQLQALLLAGKKITHSHSGDFTVADSSAAAVAADSSGAPEPRLISLAALAGLLLVIVVRKRRQAA